jgi:hypothetical protein
MAERAEAAWLLPNDPKQHRGGQVRIGCQDHANYPMSQQHNT